MLFSVSYHSANKTRADEIKCPFNQLGQISKFIIDNKDKRYVITNVNGSTASKAMQQVDLIKDAVKYSIECNQITTLKGLLNQGYNAYLKFPIVDWESFMSLIELGVSDIYIDGAIGFQSSLVRQAVKDTNILIRVSPTVSPNAAIAGLEPNSFFIRPEDLHLYDGIIDIIDFQMTEQEKEDALFSIYKRGTFNYGIEDLLEYCQFTAPNPFIKPEFGNARLTCGQRCKTPGFSCHLCNTQISLTNTVYEYFTLKDGKDQPNQSS